MPAVKSLLVRARLGLVEAAEARSTDCAVIRDDLVAAYDRGVKASGRARRHMKECAGCREYRTALRGVRSSFAALTPGAGAAALAAKLFGLGGGGAAAGGAAASGGGAAATGAAAVGGATACKVAAVACAAALTAGGAVEVKNLADHAPAKHRAEQAAAHAVTNPSPTQRRAALSSAAAAAPAPLTAPVAEHPAASTKERKQTKAVADAPLAPPSIPIYQPTGLGGATPGTIDAVSGGVTAPAEPPVTADPVTDDATEPLVPVADPPATTGDGSTTTGGETAPADPSDELRGARDAGRPGAAAGQPRTPLASGASTATWRPSSTRSCSSAAAGGRASSPSSPSTRRRAAPRSAAAACGPTPTRATRSPTRCASRAR